MKLIWSVEISLENGKLIIMLAPKSKLTLKQLLVGVNKKNLHDEVDTGLTMGSEAWQIPNGIMMDIGRALYVRDRRAWREWLEANFNTEKEIWLFYPSKESGNPRIPYNDAVEEALSFGWIDQTLAHDIQLFYFEHPLMVLIQYQLNDTLLLP